MLCRAAPTLEYLVAQGGNPNAAANDGTKPIDLVPKPDTGNLAGNPPHVSFIKQLNYLVPTPVDNIWRFLGKKSLWKLNLL